MHVTHSSTAICKDEIVKVKPSRRIQRRKNSFRLIPLSRNLYARK